MQFKENASVFTAHGEQVGDIDRVVLDPRTKEVTHIVVRKGFLFTEDKVVSVDLIASATEDRVVLREDAGDLQHLPDFEVEHFVLLNEAEFARTQARPDFPPPLYAYPPFYGTAYGTTNAYPASPTRTHVTRMERNVPEDTVALEEGAQVISADGEHVGDVERVLTGPQADRATHFVISQGLLLKEKKLVPAIWVDSIYEDKVHLAVGSRLVEELREYHD
jgi:uncharacterized protein YrrD